MSCRCRESSVKKPWSRYLAGASTSGVCRYNWDRGFSGYYQQTNARSFWQRLRSIRMTLYGHFTVRYILSFDPRWSRRLSWGSAHNITPFIWLSSHSLSGSKIVLSPLYWILLCLAEPLHAIKMLNHVIKALPSITACSTQRRFGVIRTASRCIHCLYRVHYRDIVQCLLVRSRVSYGKCRGSASVTRTRATVWGRIVPSGDVAQTFSAYWTA